MRGNTRALRIWRDAYRQARATDDISSSIATANSELLAQTGIIMLVHKNGIGDVIGVEARCPGGASFIERRLNKRTPATKTLTLALTEIALSNIRAHDMEATA